MTSRILGRRAVLRGFGATACVLATPLLAACGTASTPPTAAPVSQPSPAPTPAAASKPASAQKSLSVIGQNNPVHKEFAAKYAGQSGVQVNYDVYPSQWQDAVNKFTLWGQTGYDGVDVAAMDDQIGGLWVANDWLTDLSGMLTNERKDDLVDGIKTLYNAVGKVTRSFFSLDLEPFYYNKDLIPTPPKTWDELVEAAKKVTKPDADVWGWRPPSSGDQWNLTLMMLNQAGAGTTKLDDKPTLTALQFMRDWVFKHKITPTSTTTEGVAELIGLAAAGKAGMWWGYGSLYSRAIAVQNAVLTNKNLGVARWPKGPVDDNGIIHGWGWTIPKFARKKDDSMEYLKWYVRPEVQKELTVKTSVAPPWKSLFKDPDVVKAVPLLAVEPGWAELIRGARFRAPVVTSKHATELFQVFQDLGSYVLSGQKTPEQAQEWAVKEIKAAL